MLKNSFQFTGFAALAVGALVLTGCTAEVAEVETLDASVITEAETITLSYAFFAPAQSFPAVQMQEWADQISERTDGQVEVELFVGGTLLSSGDIFDGVTAGIVDIGLDSPAYDTGRFPFSSVINIPIGMESAETSSRTFLQLLEEYEPEEFAGFEIITAFTTEASYLQTKTPIVSESDISGTSLRAAGANVPLLGELGAAAIGMSMAEVSEALNTGVIQGYISSREVTKDFGLAESISYITDYPFGTSNSFVAVMDKARFDSLPENVKAVIGELREEMMLFASQGHDDSIQAAIDFSRDEHGVEVLEVSGDTRTMWDRILQGQADQWLKKNADSYFDAEAVLARMRELATENAAR
jgi:TRAP-type C4-dicarboxylate transport system substrate-binding protein